MQSALDRAYSFPNDCFLFELCLNKCLVLLRQCSSPGSLLLVREGFSNFGLPLGILVTFSFLYRFVCLLVREYCNEMSAPGYRLRLA